MLDLDGNKLKQGDRVEHVDGTRIGTVLKLMITTVSVRWDDGETFGCKPEALVKITVQGN